ncbi:hypothetical protein AGR56_09185 [Clostridium sp. DMHC 10]|uniref:hypothetical protein n=1 Tax=Clostridium sp. DMHC 10 TaxID=747377 RepID=UPI0006C197AF|nr:hypothetical protein [Clostridium sp. DMHC 10]KOF56823.1 hypothetical protein AGR56_09185 [Clostridium sp. DMHC 10]
MISNNTLMLISVIGVTFGALGAMLGVVPYLKKKNVNVDGAIKELNNKGEIVKAVADELKPILPKSAQTVIEIIEKWAPIAVGKAEQLYHAGDIQKDDRAQIAENVVLSVLKEMNINLDDNKKELIDAAIKNAVKDLGHAPVSEAEKNKQLQDALNKADTLQSQNLQLQQKLNTIKSTAVVQ